jgi:cytochrome c oxidase subunit III
LLGLAEGQAGGRVVKTRIELDLSGTPTEGFGHRVLPWWGTMGFIALEGMGFVLSIGMFLYIPLNDPQWPLGFPPQPLAWSSAFTLLLLVSLIPNWLVFRRAVAHDNRALKPLLVLMSLIGIAVLVIRWFEFQALTIHWDTNVYGSLLWVLLGLHTAHLLTDVADTIVMTAIFFTGHTPNGRFSDADENAFYWVFVVVGWLPIYALLYWSNRLGVG